MSRHDGQIASTPDVLALRSQHGLHVASVGATGWPCVQHRGGSPGSLRVLDDATLGWAGFGGDEPYVTTGGIAGDDRAAIAVVDHAGQRAERS